MIIEIKVPALPESVSDATIAAWHASEGKFVKKGENLIDLETDKVVLEVPAPEDGIIEKILKKQGDTVRASDVIGVFKAGAQGAASAPAAAKAEPAIAKAEPVVAKATATKEPVLTPAARRKAAEQGVTAHATKPASTVAIPAGERTEQRVPMTRMRARIAERLLEVSQQTAMLTTFNEVNMKPIMDLRAKYKDKFEKEHNVKLGFMSFFVKASVEALKRFPTVNASIDGNDIVYHGYFDVGIAVSTERGLVVPVLRNADKMSLAEIEIAIRDFAVKARDNKLTLDDMSGGTFTITNGGVFGSLLSTPILNAPQSAILGMHSIQERPVVEEGHIVARPMMYLALSYDHRIIDGKNSVSFLVTLKEFLEYPARLVLGV